jgi:hypothetical protein
LEGRKVAIGAGIVATLGAAALLALLILQPGGSDGTAPGILDRLGLTKPSTGDATSEQESIALPEQERERLAATAAQAIAANTDELLAALESLAAALVEGDVLVDGRPLLPFGEGADIVSLEPYGTPTQVYRTPSGELVYFFYASGVFVFEGDEIARTTRLPLRNTAAGWAPSPYLPESTGLQFVDEIRVE